MKKINTYVKISLSLILVTVLLLIVLSPVTQYAEAYNYDEIDSVFVKTMRDILEDTYFEENLNITSNKEIVYDMHLKELGVMYNFTINGEEGYAIIINRYGYFEVAEVFFDTSNPFGKEEGYYIFVCPLTYIIYNEGNYKYINKEDKIADQVLDYLEEISYSSNDYAISISNETINFTARNENSFELAKKFPINISLDNLANDCVPVAGANIIQYWDRYATNLIPNFEPGKGNDKIYLYTEKSTRVSEVISTLYNDMGTVAQGTTVNMFKNGFSKYCSRQGYSAIYTSSMSGGIFNNQIAHQLLNSKQPLIVFVDSCIIVSISSVSQSDQLEKMILNGAHAMAVFGYKDVEYTLSNSIRKDNYLCVSTGLIQKSKGYLNINNIDIIDDAYGVYIN